MPANAAARQDAVSVEVFANLFKAVVDEMAWIVLRSSHTTFVKETQDFGVALVTPEGEMFAYPYGSGATPLMGVAMHTATQAVAWEPGDVLITNDPFSTHGMVMHLNDIYLFRPVFVGGELLCFAWSFIHCTDVGGYAPGSIDMQNSEVFQEGLRLRPVKLFRRGALNEEVWNIFADNCRIPSLNWGDITACVAALTKAEARLSRVAERYGRDEVKEAMYGTLDRTERLTRQVLAEIPAGRIFLCRIFRGRLRQRRAGPASVAAGRARRRDDPPRLYRLRPAGARRTQPADGVDAASPVSGDGARQFRRHPLGGVAHQRRHIALHRSGAARGVGRQRRLSGGLRHALYDGDAGARSGAGRAQQGDPGRGAGRRFGDARRHLCLDLGIGRRRPRRRRQSGFGGLGRQPRGATASRARR